MRGKLSFGLGMKPGIVAHVDKIGLFGTCRTGKVYGCLDGLMRAMRSMTQTVNHKRMYTAQCLQRFLGSCEHISNKSQRSYPIAENRELAMHHLQGKHLNTLYDNGVKWFYRMKVQSRDTGIKHLTKEIGQTLAQVTTSEIIGKDVDIAKATEGTQVIDTSRMIIMLVGEQYAIKTVKGYTHHLLTKVGTAINKYTCRIGLYQCRDTQATVTHVR